MSPRRAVVSVWDKTGLVAFARGLVGLGMEVISTGGTQAALEQGGVPVRPVEALTGVPGFLDGRVKTLHPKIFGGILARRDEPRHLQELRTQGIELVDLVVVNFYPFEDTVRRPGASLAEAVEAIDIGGPCLLRAGAKNFQAVGVVSDPRQYEGVLRELTERGGELSLETRARLAQAAFARTWAYDVAISRFLGGRTTAGEGGGLPDTVSWTFEKVQDLRYGENPHQRAALYREGGAPAAGLAGAQQRHGKALSFNNLLDVQAAWLAVLEFEEPAAAIVKHTNPCGVACAPTVGQAVREAYACDPLSSYGGIVGMNRPVDQEAAEALLGCEFLECVVAPSVGPEALARLQGRKNLRIVEVGTVSGALPGWDLRRVVGGVLVQDWDPPGHEPAARRVVSRRPPTPQEARALTFAWKVAKHVKSNAIVLARGTQTVGVGSGQTSRVDAVAAAVRKAGPRAAGAVLASDGFFPRADGVEVAARAGVTAVIHPGGSIRDAEVIQAADQAGLAMVCTETRHFRH